MEYALSSISLICLGACLLAAAYHSVLYVYYRDKLLLHYVGYLTCMSAFIFIRSPLCNIIFGDAITQRIEFDLNEGLQVFYFTLYVNFGARAVEITKKKNPFVYKGWRLLSIIILTYGVSVIILHMNNIELPIYFFIGIRIFILLMSCALLWRSYIMKVSIFQRWILFGCIYFLICGLMSFLANSASGQLFILYPLEWLQVGNLGEILFFSSAMGYRLKTVNDERLIAINQATEEKAIAQQLRFEKANAIIQTRLEERNRIAQDMHDDLGSGLTKIAILSEVAKTQLQQPTQAKVQLDNIAVSARELVDNLQDIIWILNSKNDTVESLASYVREYALKFFEPFETNLRFIYPDDILDIKLSEEQRRNFFLVIKETLNNAAKHAWANTLTIQLIQSGNEIKFIIEDDGKGFDISNQRLFGNGLQNMRLRMEQVNGSYTITSLPGKGTRTTLFFGV